MRYVKIIIGVLIIIIGVVFVLQNRDLQRPVRLRFDPASIFQDLGGGPDRAPAAAAGQTETGGGQAGTTTDSGQPASPGGLEAAAPSPRGIPVFVLIFLAFFAGVLVASLYGALDKFRLKKAIRTRTSRARELEEELKRLRNLPLKQAVTQPALAPARTANDLEVSTGENGRGEVPK